MRTNKILNIIRSCIYQNNLLHEKKLTILNFGNVSLRIDDDHCTIKPSGIGTNVKKITSQDMPIINIHSGEQISGRMKPSSDTLTHLEIYKRNKLIQSAAHTHSTYATSWSQSGKDIPVYGTTHADYWNGKIPTVPFLKKKYVIFNYEKNTGIEIIKKLNRLKLKIENCPGILVAGHGPFCWGNSHEDSVLHCEILEFIAKIATLTLQIGLNKKLPKYISEKHFNRKNGKNSYYGQ